MFKVLVCLLLLSSCSLRAQCDVVRHISGNFAYDLQGVPDNREGTWGTAEADYRTLTFTAPPAGNRIRILRITGDLTARWIRPINPGVTFNYLTDVDKSYNQNGYTGVLAAIHNPSSSGSAYADLAADGHYVYVQGDIGSTGVVRVPFDQTFDKSDPGAVLEPNNQLIFKFAKYLDETGYWTHGEITFSQIDFCYDSAP